MKYNVLFVILALLLCATAVAAQKPTYGHFVYLPMVVGSSNTTLRPTLVAPTATYTEIFVPIPTPSMTPTPTPGTAILPTSTPTLLMPIETLTPIPTPTSTAMPTSMPPSPTNTPTQTPQPISCPVQFDFDDGYESTYTLAFPILNRHGCTGTANIVPSFVGKSGFMTRDQILTLYHAGWAIGSHSMTHPYLTKITSERVEYEVGGSLAWLNGLGVETNYFAVPYNSYNNNIMAVICSYYDRARISWPNEINQAGADTCIRKSVFTISSTTVEELEAWVDQAIEIEGELILGFHRIDESGVYNWSSGQLEEIVEYITK